MKITAIVVAAGRGSRMGADKNKVFLKLSTRTVLEYTLCALATPEIIDDIILVTREEDIAACKKITRKINKPITIAKGGSTRQESVLNGLLQVRNADIVLIHDAARALVTEDIIKETIDHAIITGAAAAGVPCKDSLKSVTADGFIASTIDRDSTYMIQTPQTFRYADILKAHKIAHREGFCATDDCALYEKYIGRVKVTAGSYDNIKLTTPDDMIIAKNILKSTGFLSAINMRRKFHTNVKIIIQRIIVKHDRRRRGKK